MAERKEEKLPPLHQGKFTYSPKLPTQEWKEIESIYEEKQKETAKICAQVTERTKNYNDEREIEIRENIKKSTRERTTKPGPTDKMAVYTPKESERENPEQSSTESEEERGGTRAKK